MTAVPVTLDQFVAELARVTGKPASPDSYLWRDLDLTTEAFWWSELRIVLGRWNAVSEPGFRLGAYIPEEGEIANYGDPGCRTFPDIKVREFYAFLRFDA